MSNKKTPTVFCHLSWRDPSRINRFVWWRYSSTDPIQWYWFKSSCSCRRVCAACVCKTTAEKVEMLSLNSPRKLWDTTVMCTPQNPSVKDGNRPLSRGVQVAVPPSPSSSLSKRVTKSIWRHFLKGQLRMRWIVCGLGDLCRGAGGRANRKQIAQCGIGIVSARCGRPKNRYSHAFKTKFGGGSHPPGVHVQIALGRKYGDSNIIVTEAKYLANAKKKNLMRYSSRGEWTRSARTSVGQRFTCRTTRQHVFGRR